LCCRADSQRIALEYVEMPEDAMSKLKSSRKAEEAND